jgi:hypothetical protein
MNEPVRYILYACLFFGIFITASVFLNSGVRTRNVHDLYLAKYIAGNPIIVRSQVPDNSVTDCMSNLMKNLQSGSLDFGDMGKQMDSCFGSGLSNSGNDTGIVPEPQGNNELIPQPL